MSDQLTRDEVERLLAIGKTNCAAITSLEDRLCRALLAAWDDRAAEEDYVLERFDQTEPKLQREIVVAAFKEINRLRAALEDIANTNKPFVPYVTIAREALERKEGSQ